MRYTSNPGFFSFPKFHDFSPFFFSSIENSPSSIEVDSWFKNVVETKESIVNDKRYFEVFSKAKVITTTTTTRQERALCHWIIAFVCGQPIRGALHFPLVALYHACANALRAIVFYVPGGYLRYSRKFRSREKFERKPTIFWPIKFFFRSKIWYTCISYTRILLIGEKVGQIFVFRLRRARALMEDKKIDLIRAKIESVAGRKHVCFNYEVRGKRGIIIPQEK